MDTLDGSDGKSGTSDLDYPNLMKQQKHKLSSKEAYVSMA